MRWLRLMRSPSSTKTSCAGRPRPLPARGPASPCPASHSAPLSPPPRFPADAVRWPATPRRGACVSIFTICVITFLFLSEVATFLTLDKVHRLEVDSSLGEKLRISFDVTFPRLPCAMVSQSSRRASRPRLQRCPPTPPQRPPARPGSLAHPRSESHPQPPPRHAAPPRHRRTTAAPPPPDPLLLHRPAHAAR